MSLTALQLASSIADLEDFFVHERHVLQDLLSQASAGGSFEDGLAVGASSLQSIFEVEAAIDIALRRLEQALLPLELDKSIGAIRHRELFTCRSGQSFQDSLEESLAILCWRNREMSALREHLLQIGEDDLQEAYSDGAEGHFQTRLDSDLENLLRRSNM